MTDSQGTSPTDVLVTGPLSRRRVLATAGVVGAVGALAACSGSSDTSNPATSVPATPSTPAESSSGTSGGSSSAPAADALVASADVPVGGGIVIDGDEPLVVTQATAGSFACFSAICPHQGCTVGDVTATAIVCPCHGSQFSPTDGAVMTGPATTGLTEVPITESGGSIILA